MHPRTKSGRQIVRRPSVKTDICGGAPQNVLYEVDVYHTQKRCDGTRMPLLLAALGVTTSLLAIGINAAIVWILSMKAEVYIRVGPVACAALSCGLALLSAFGVRRFAPEAAGSGIPEMQTAMAGTYSPL